MEHDMLDEYRDTPAHSYYRKQTWLHATPSVSPSASHLPQGGRLYLDSLSEGGGARQSCVTEGAGQGNRMTLLPLHIHTAQKCRKPLPWKRENTKRLNRVNTYNISCFA
jgi:hypothetical protein